MDQLDLKNNSPVTTEDRPRFAQILPKGSERASLDELVRTYRRHGSDEERQAARLQADKANKEKTKQQLAKIRQGRDSIEEEPLTPAATLKELDGLIDKHQLGTINAQETEKLKNMLIERYKK